ncbi:MAG: adenylyltransferase/cytidyltransferase family protein, partial [Candidatus Aenigmatarchaeota archaeon]
MDEKVVAVSGGFDPVHIGHLDLLRDAKSLGDRLVVILNNDNWLRDKKGYAFMDEKEKKEILEEFECVDEVVITQHGEEVKDPSVCEALKRVRPDVFANGGDRKEHNVPEYDLCERLGIEMVFNVGGGKKQSSSELVKNARKRGMK